VCLVTLLAFLFNIMAFDVAWADNARPAHSHQTADNVVQIDSVKALSVKSFSLPEYLGEVKGLYDAGSDQIVINIQDAHCNYACQQKIAEILEYFNKEYGIDNINLEGGSKNYDLSIFTDIQDEPARKRVADYFVREGLVSGAESFAINNPGKVSLWGIEDGQLYLKNLDVYRKSLQHKDQIEKHLKSLSYILSTLKVKIYSKELLDLDSKSGSYRSGNLELKDYVTYLSHIAGKSSLDTETCKNTVLLAKVLAEETRIDFKLANSQRDELIDRLSKKLAKVFLEEFIAKAVGFKSQTIPHKEFYAYLINKAKAFRVQVDDFKEFAKYVAYVSIYDGIDKTKMIAELDDIDAAIRERLYQNDDQRRLGELSKNLRLLKDIFNILSLDLTINAITSSYK
jgi:hypothetical protein